MVHSHRGSVSTTFPILILTALFAAAPHARPAAQGPPADLASKMTGAWKLNKELSPDLSAPAPPGGRQGRRGGGALFAIAAPQRGGRGGGGGGGGGGVEPANMMPAEVAAQAALDVLHQVAVEFRIEASPTAISFIEPRGRWDFTTDGKTMSIPVPGGAIKGKSKWEHNSLRQEFSSTQRKLLKSWSIDGDGRLVLTEHIESLEFNSKESKAVYDRQ
jgi:hypothetical protein